MSKSLVYGIVTAAILATSGVEAGLLDVSIGANLWFVDAKGYTGGEHAFNLHQEYNNKYMGVVWMNIEHPLPLVPNVGVRYGSFDHTSNGIKADMTYGDVIGYYNLLDLSPLKLDAGIGFRFEDFSYDHAAGDTSYEHVLPYVYGHGAFSVIGTGLTLDAEAAVMDMPFQNDTQLLDAKFGIDYNFGGSFIDWSVNGGYRYMYLTQDTDDYNGLTTIIKGPYIGIAGAF